MVYASKVKSNGYRRTLADVIHFLIAGRGIFRRGGLASAGWHDIEPGDRVTIDNKRYFVGQ